MMATLLAATGAAAEPAATLEIEADRCPSSEQVRAQLGPLVEDDALALELRTPTARLRVADLGASYRIEVGGTVREIADADRDCVERARVAAVFIAMNLGAPPPAVALPPAPAMTGVGTAGSVPPPPRPSTAEGRAELLLAPEYTVAPRVPVGTFGIRAGLGLRASGLRADLTAGGFAPVRLELPSSAAPGGAVELIRIPTELRFAWPRALGRLEFGPLAALAVDLLLFRGRELPAAHPELRASPGAGAGMLLRTRASRRAWAYSTASVVGFPLDYRLEVENRGTVGHAPRWWLGVSLGLSWALGR